MGEVSDNVGEFADESMHDVQLESRLSSCGSAPGDARGEQAGGDLINHHTMLHAGVVDDGDPFAMDHPQGTGEVAGEVTVDPQGVSLERGCRDEVARHPLMVPLAGGNVLAALPPMLVR